MQTKKFSSHSNSGRFGTVPEWAGLEGRPYTAVFCNLQSSFSIYYLLMGFLRFVLLLSLTVWVGALIFFPVVAQTSFSVLPSAHLAGLVVRNSLIALHWMGIGSGIIFLACSLMYNRLVVGRMRIFAASHILVLLMLALTAISQFQIIPRMDALRISAGEIAALPAVNPARAEFDSLHAWSTRIEMAVLVLGLIVLYAVARRFSRSQL